MTILHSLKFIRLLRVVITPSVTLSNPPLLRGENDSKQSDEFLAKYRNDKKKNNKTNNMEDHINANEGMHTG